MLIGVAADSHDNLPAVRAAVEVLAGRGARHLLIAGDIVAPFAARAWKAFPGPLTAVFGNNDGERRGLSRALGDIHAPPLAFSLGDRRVLMTHDAAGLPAAPEADLVVVGHSHRPAVERVGAALLVNPGEVGGWVTGRRTCAVVDLASLEAEILDL